MRGHFDSMGQIEAVAMLFVFAALRYLPVIVLPSMTPLSWAPAIIRIVLLLSLSMLSVLALPSIEYRASWMSSEGLILACFSELLIGLTFSLAIIFPQAAIGFVMRVADMQAGFSAASMFNPTGQHEPESLLGSVVLLAVTVLFFILDMHVQLFRIIFESVQVIPLGQIALHLNIDGFFELLGNSFLLGLAVAAPIIVGLFAVDIGVAYATRSMPQANVYFLALPLKIVIALFLLALTMGYVPTLIRHMYQSAFNQLPAVLGG